MQIILSDHNCEGHAEAIFNVLRYDELWLELVPNLDKPEPKFQPQRRKERKEKLCELCASAVKILVCCSSF